MAVLNQHSQWRTFTGHWQWEYSAVEGANSEVKYSNMGGWTDASRRGCSEISRVFSMTDGNKKVGLKG